MNIVIRGRYLNYKKAPDTEKDKSAYEYNEDGALLIKNGIISDLGNFDKINDNLSQDIKIIDHRPNLIMPGFIDTHIHFPQIQIIGSYATNLLEWLNNYTFIEEQKYSSLDHSTIMAKKFFNEILNHGTTTAAVFCSVHPESVEAFFNESHKINTLMIAGKVMMDRNAPEKLLDSAHSGYEESKKLIEKWHGVGRQHYAISPRFAITSSPRQLEMTQALMNDHPECYFQTHLSENINEIELVKKLFPDKKDYSQVYEDYNFLGPKSLFGHCIHLNEREINIMKETDSVAVFCPTSNLFLGSGLFNFQKLKQNSVRIATGTDIGGGTNYSMLKTMDEAHKILQLQSQKLTPLESFYQLTLGNASALSLQEKIGTLEIGSDADIVVLDSSSTSAMKIRMKTVDNLLEELFILQTMGDDRAISQVYVKGVQFKNS